MGRGLIVDRHGIKMAAVVCMSIIVFFAMALVPPIASADTSGSCTDLTLGCYKDYYFYIGLIKTSGCPQGSGICMPCDGYEALNKKCNEKFSQCENRCVAKSGVY